MEQQSELLTIENRGSSLRANDLPTLVKSAGPGARFAYKEFFHGTIRNPNTRRAYRQAVHRFLAWCEPQNLQLHQLAPAHVGRYFDGYEGATATKKLHLAGLRHFFDGLVQRHVVVLNPANSVRGERHQVIEGKTPEISKQEARQLMASIDTRRLVGLRDRSIIATLIYTAARVGAIARLKGQDFVDAGNQYFLRFTDKGGKSREIPVRHDLERLLQEYISLAGLDSQSRQTPLFRTAAGRTDRLTDRAMSAIDITRMVKRRLRDAGLPSRLSPHSMRVAAITDLLSQGISLAEVQYLAGHADPRTTRLYDRRQQRVTRNIVERISI